MTATTTVQRPSRSVLGASISRVPLLRAVGLFLFFAGLPLGETNVGTLLLLGWGLTTSIATWRRPLPTLLFGATGLTKLVVWSATGFVVAMMLSAITSEQPIIATGTAIGFTIAMFVGLTCGYSLTADDLLPRYLLPTLSVSAIVASLYSMYTYFVVGQVRATGIFTGENGLGTACTVALFLLVGLIQHERGWRSVLGLASIPFIATALVLSLSRGALIGMAIGLLVYAWKHRRVFAIGMVLAAIMAAIPLYAIPNGSRLASLTPTQNFDRVALWSDAIHMIRDHPITGVGGGVFQHVHPRYNSTGRTDSPAFAHNMVLQVTAEFGILGLIPFLCLLGSVCASGLMVVWQGSALHTSVFAAFVSVLVHDMVDNVTWGMWAATTFWLLAGIMMSGRQITLHHDEIITPRRSLKGSEDR